MRNFCKFMHFYSLFIICKCYYYCLFNKFIPMNAILDPSLHLFLFSFNDITKMKQYIKREP